MKTRVRFPVHDPDRIIRRDAAAMAPQGPPAPLRHSRGLAPKPIRLREEYPDVLALGPQLKSTLCILKGAFAFLSPHIGDLETPQARDFFHETIALMKRITECDPGTVACDLHPGYYATRAAQDLPGKALIPVQHHHAHIAACMAEHGISGDVIGLAMDGTGYGTDGNAWGGEFLVAGERAFTRKGHIRYFILPGGEKAVREPWRIAVSLLRDAYGDTWPELALKLKLIPDRKQIELLNLAMERRINSPLASGLGRAFDGIAALAGLRRTVAFEGQAAMELEASAEGKTAAPYPFEFNRSPEGERLLDLNPTVRAATEDVLAGKGCGEISASFHRMLCRAFSEMAQEVGHETGLNRVVLSGGCFQNRILLAGCIEALGGAGFEVFIHRDVPANDGGISLGQAVVAGAIQKLKKGT